MKRQKSGILFLVICLIVSLLLASGAAFLLRGKAEANEEAKKEAAFKEVFPDAVSFGDAVYNDTFLKRYLEEDGFSEDEVVVNKVSLARDDHQNAKGIVATVSVYKKYGGIISMLVGVRNDGTVNDYSVLRITEAKNLDTQVKEGTFKNQFSGKKEARFTLVNSAPSLSGEIEAASGAEDASAAVVLGVNAAVRSVSFIDEVYGGLLNK